MSTLTEETKRERETIIRWDETNEDAILWTTSVSVRNEWKANGFPVVPAGKDAWTCRVPSDRLTYRVFRKKG